MTIIWQGFGNCQMCIDRTWPWMCWPDRFPISSGLPDHRISLALSLPNFSILGVCTSVYVLAGNMPVTTGGLWHRFSNSQIHWSWRGGKLILVAHRFASWLFICSSDGSGIHQRLTWRRTRLELRDLSGKYMWSPSAPSACRRNLATLLRATYLNRRAFERWCHGARTYLIYA